MSDALSSRRSAVRTPSVSVAARDVGPHEVGHEGGEAVVVAEADLVVRDGVVLVDQGHHAELEQALEGGPGV